MADVLREALTGDQVQVAFVFGSVAGGVEKAHSDIDLMVVGSLGLRQLTKGLAGLAEKLGREINPHVLTAAEFRRRRREGDHFLCSTLETPRLFVIGDEHELEDLG